jgi:uncharacterized membrane protein
MTAKTFLTISSIFAILYGLSFLLVPGQSIAMYGTEPEPHLVLLCRFLGSALLAFGIVQWFSKEFRDWDAVRAVLIAIAVLNALNLLVNLWGTAQGLFNAMAWSTTIVNIIFLAGALYCLSVGAETRLSFSLRATA